jgi:hypothetical protein
MRRVESAVTGSLELEEVKALALVNSMAGRLKGSRQGDESHKRMNT